jgi:hypothetical protein
MESSLAKPFDLRTSSSEGLIPKDMTRSHLPNPAEAFVVDVGSEAKIVDVEDHVAPPKPAGSRCKLCESSEDPHLLIKPCRCSGENKYVHRDCLDQQRAFNQNNQGFMHCRECEYRYWIDLKESCKALHGNNF